MLPLSIAAYCIYGPSHVKVSIKLDEVVILRVSSVKLSQNLEVNFIFVSIVCGFTNQILFLVVEREKTPEIRVDKLAVVTLRYKMDHVVSRLHAAASNV